MKLRFVLVSLVTSLAASVTVAPSAFAAESHWTKHQAAKHYVRDVRPSNKELDRWAQLDQGTLHLGALTNQAGRVARSELALVQSLIRGKWTPHVDSLIKKLEVRVLDEVGHWQDVASARTLGQLQHAVAELPSGSKAANRVRHVLGLPTVS